jgi:hypothetical protein
MEKLRQSRISEAEAHTRSRHWLALELGDVSRTAIFPPIRNMAFPNDGTAELDLRMLIKKELQMKPGKHRRNRAFQISNPR